MVVEVSKKPVAETFDNSVGIVEQQYVTVAETPDEYLELECGTRFGPVTVAYETYGRMNAEKSNVILLCHALSGSAHAAGYHGELGRNPGWWENSIGPGKAFDTDKYFIISSNILGSCYGTSGPPSVNPSTGNPYGIDFPVITIGDMVQVQRMMLDKLGIPHLLAVGGGSIGAMQTLEWMMRYPDRVSSGLVIAGTSRISAQCIAFNAVGRNSILTDKNWNNGDYYGKALPAEGLAIARMVGHITYLSDESMHAKFGRRLRKSDKVSYALSQEFQVESYLDHQGNKFVERFDANAYLYISKAMDYFDAAQSHGQGQLDEAFEKIKSRVLVVSYSSDWLFPPYQSREMVDALIQKHKDVTYINIDTPCGHDAFLLEVDIQSKIIRNFLGATYDRQKRTS